MNLKNNLIKLFGIFLLVVAILFLWFALRGDIVIPPAIYISNISFRLYGLIIGLAVLLLISLVERNSPPENRIIISNTWIYILAGTIIGARLWHVWTDFDLYKSSIWDAFKIWNGGLSLFGALCGGLIGMAISLKIYKRLDIYIKFLDQIFLFLPLSQALGRLGNFVNQELYGSPTNLPWGMYVRPENRHSGFENYSYFHPAFLYEMIGNLCLFSILYFLNKKLKNRPNGLFIGVYLLGYGIIRSITNLFRLDRVYAGDVGMWTSIGMSVIGLLYLTIIFYKDYKNSK